MGMFDSLIIECPKCKKDLEIQSKSGCCMLDVYNKNNLPAEVAVGLNGDVIECEFCRCKFIVKCNIPKPRLAQVKLIRTNKMAKYSGNYNPALSKNKKKDAVLRKLLGVNKNGVKLK